jgi:hypothetical protein
MLTTMLIKAQLLEKMIMIQSKTFNFLSNIYSKYVMVRLQSAVDIPALTKVEGKYTISAPLSSVTKLKEIIFYTHGGGFLSMSSFNH